MVDEKTGGIIILDDSQMIVVRKDFLVDGLVTPCDIYLKAGPAKYLLIGKKGNKIQLSGLSSFNNPSSKVYVQNNDHQLLMNLFAKLAEKVVMNKGVSDQIKAKFVSNLTEDLIRNFEEKQLAQPEQLRRVSGLVLELSNSVLGLQQAINLLTDLGKEDARFIMASCFISLLIAEELGGMTRAAQEKIALGCLLQDVGLKYVPTEILVKPRHEWTQHDNTIYEAHPLKSVEMVMDMKDLSHDVLLMISEHHENANGTGFPKRTRDLKISPFGRIIIVANDLGNLLYPRMEGARSFTATEALEFMENVMGAPYNKQVFRALKNIVNKNLFYLKQAK